MTTTCEPWPCEWCAGVPPEGSTPEQQLLAAEQATEVLTALSGYQFGRCRRQFHITTGDVCGLWPTRLTWHSRPRPDPCCVIPLGHAPEVHEVTVDGTILDPTEYRLQGKWLVRVDGTCWPATPACDPPRTIVDVTTGVFPPKIAERAVGELAEQIIASCTPGATCMLPSRVVSVNRQGVGMTLLDPIDYTNAGRLGLAICDTFLMSFNPDNLRRNSAVISPDTRQVQWL